MTELKLNYWLCVDDREKATRPTIAVHNRPIEFKRLSVGDYACSCNCVGFERKEEDAKNLRQTMLQCSELVESYPVAILIINKNGKRWIDEQYASRHNFVASCIASGLGPPLFIDDHAMMLDIIYRTIDKLHDGKDRSANRFIHTRHVSIKDRQINILAALPGVGIGRARLILQNYESVIHFMTATEEEMLTMDGFGPETVRKIRGVLYGTSS